MKDSLVTRNTQLQLSFRSVHFIYSLKNSLKGVFKEYRGAVGSAAGTLGSAGKRLCVLHITHLINIHLAHGVT